MAPLKQKAIAEDHMYFSHPVSVAGIVAICLSVVSLDCQPGNTIFTELRQIVTRDICEDFKPIFFIAKM